MSSTPRNSTHEIIGSEEKLRNRVLRFLHLKNVPGVEDIYADVTGGVVTLRGHMPTSQDRRLCIECCRHVPGVLRVKNELTTED